jgi:hypothetical protein
MRHRETPGSKSGCTGQRAIGVDSVDIEVRRPMVSVEVHKDVPADRLITLEEESSNLKSEKLTPAFKPTARTTTTSKS